jgi:hypothetical protein
MGLEEVGEREAEENERDSDERQVAVTYFTPERFAASPQVGLPITQTWESFRTWLSSPSFGETKREAGAWCPCALEGGIVRAGTGRVSLLVFDVDEAGPNGMTNSFEELKSYQGVIAPTFSATPENRKHRIVLLPSRDLTAGEFKIVWPTLNRRLASFDRPILIDQGCKNLNRLYFACVARSPEAWLGAVRLDGAPVDVDRSLEFARAAREAEENERVARLANMRPVDEAHRDKYVRGAIESARRNIEGAGEGGRHDALLREAFSLARLELTQDEIERELLPSFVAVAGEPRRNEGTCAIRDAVKARGRT